jgi:1,4-alpha-glucan branching enzyme
LFGYMYGQPGKKLLFMGGEWGQWQQWKHDGSLDWDQTHHWPHEGIQRWVADLNRVYSEEAALHEMDCRPGGFEWVDCNDSAAGVVSFLRKTQSGHRQVLAVYNFTPVARMGYRVGVPAEGFWKELINSDAADYGGSGVGNYGGHDAQQQPWHNQPCSLSLNIPPLGVVFFRGPGG